MSDTDLTIIGILGLIASLIEIYNFLLPHFKKISRVKDFFPIRISIIVSPDFKKELQEGHAPLKKNELIHSNLAVKVEETLTPESNIELPLFPPISSETRIHTVTCPSCFSRAVCTNNQPLFKNFLYH